MDADAGQRERDRRIVEQVVAGASYAEVAREHRLSRQRISQIMRSYCPEWDGVLRRSNRATRREVADEPVERRFKVQTKGRPRVWTDEKVLAALVAASTDGRAPSVSWWRTSRLSPSATAVIARFGSWNAACAAAGLTVADAPMPSADPLPDSALIAAVVEFLADPNASEFGGARAYESWAKHMNAPSAAMLRTRFGSWSKVKALAVAHLMRTRDN